MGEFDRMYREASSVPWAQDRVAESPDVRVLLALLEPHGPFGSILDVGCGLGYFAHELEATGEQVYGVDVSDAAVAAVAKNFPTVRAGVVDVQQSGAELPFERQAFDAVICRGFFWYVFPELEAVLANLFAWVRPGGLLVVHQNFPDLESDFVGRSVLPNPETLEVQLLRSADFELLAENRFRDVAADGGNDDWSSWVLRRQP